MAMRKVNTRGISNANKGMLMAAMAYNLKKYLKFSKKKSGNASQEYRKALDLFVQIQLILNPNPSFKL
jgi:hypothetical protein